MSGVRRGVVEFTSDQDVIVRAPKRTRQVVESQELEDGSDNDSRHDEMEEDERPAVRRFNSADLDELDDGMSSESEDEIDESRASSSRASLLPQEESPEAYARRMCQTEHGMTSVLVSEFEGLFKCLVGQSADFEHRWIAPRAFDSPTAVVAASDDSRDDFAAFATYVHYRISGRPEHTELSLFFHIIRIFGGESYLSMEVGAVTRVRDLYLCNLARLQYVSVGLFGSPNDVLFSTARLIESYVDVILSFQKTASRQPRGRQVAARLENIDIGMVSSFQDLPQYFVDHHEVMEDEDRDKKNKISPYEQLNNFLLVELHKGQYARRLGNVYKPKYVMFRGKQYNTGAYEMFILPNGQSDIFNWIWHHMTEERHGRFFRLLHQTGCVENAARFLLNVNSHKFPEFEPDRTAFACRNGILKLHGTREDLELIRMMQEREEAYLKECNERNLYTGLSPVRREIMIRMIARKQVLREQEEAEEHLPYDGVVFYEWDDPLRDKSICPCSFIDQEFNMEWLTMKDWMDLPSSGVNRLIDFQLEGSPYIDTSVSVEDERQGHRRAQAAYKEARDKEVRRVRRHLDPFFGRMYFDIKTLDHWESIIVLLGLAGAGKTTLERAVTSPYNSGDIKSLNAKTDLFGIASLWPSYIWIIGEMSKNPDVTQETIQQMISGETINIRPFHGKWIPVKWTAPGMLVGNHLPFRDNRGSMSRRIVFFGFERVVPPDLIQLDLEKIIESERMVTLYRFARAYRRHLFEYGILGPYNEYYEPIRPGVSEYQRHNVLPPFFHIQREVFQMKNNAVSDAINQCDALFFDNVRSIVYNKWCKLKDSFFGVESRINVVLKSQRASEAEPVAAADHEEPTDADLIESVDRIVNQMTEVDDNEVVVSVAMPYDRFKQLIVEKVRSNPETEKLKISQDMIAAALTTHKLFKFRVDRQIEYGGVKYHGEWIAGVTERSMILAATEQVRSVLGGVAAAASASSRASMSMDGFIADGDFV